MGGSDGTGIPRSSRRLIAGWGNYPREECEVYRPEFLAELSDLVARAPEPHLVARGLGRSYGDAALNAGSGVILTERLDRMLAFDPDTGVLWCEASVSLAQIIDHLLPRGFCLPVTPGTKHITVGGAIAVDAHGKNHHHSGSMSAFVEEFRLITASGEILLCSREQNPEIFWATVGGMGLTGIILDVRLRLSRIENAYLTVDYEKLPNIDALLERTLGTDENYAYAVAWMDCLATGASLGRSVMMRANPAPLEALSARARKAPLVRPWRPFVDVPVRLPNFVLNSLSMRAFNAGFYGHYRTEQVVKDYDAYLYLLDSIHHWNRIYGSRGVLQYQCLLPQETCREGFIEILEELSSNRLPSFLAVLKSLGAASGGLLSFPRPGATLSLDLPFTGPELLGVLARLDQMVLRRGGSVYLAKDACLHAETFAEMYPNLERFREIKQKVDPEQRFSSSLARRLKIVEDT